MNFPDKFPDCFLSIPNQPEKIRPNPLSLRKVNLGTLEKTTSFAAFPKFVIAVKMTYSDADRTDQRTQSWIFDNHDRKTKSLSLSGRVVGNWRFGVENRQCLCGISMNMMRSVSLSLRFEQPSAVLAACFGIGSMLNFMHFSQFLIDLWGTLGL